MEGLIDKVPTLVFYYYYLVVSMIQRVPYLSLSLEL